jgi:GT2 family glycosyltransferase
MKTGVVIPVGPGRTENLLATLRCVAEQTVKPEVVAVICDGPDAALEIESGGFPVPIAILNVPEKHHPGLPQPRNLGVKLLADLKDQGMGIDCTHVWFLDSDILVEPDCLEMYEEAMEHEPIDRVLVGPYDWMPPGVREPMPDLYNDPRWESFKSHERFEMLRGDLSAGLACFSGNLVWPVAEFQRVGGFWDELHHGRCEDGELGLRAVAMGVPISFVADARGWHMDHPRNYSWIEEANARDVPLLNNRHPWVQGEEMFVVEEDGKRFNWRCSNCSREMNTADIWAHQSTCHGGDV